MEEVLVQSRNKQNHHDVMVRTRTNKIVNFESDLMVSLARRWKVTLTDAWEVVEIAIYKNALFLPIK